MHGHDIERELDAALARYAAIKPRDGLEQRVLANLRVQHTRATRFDWRQWVAAGVLAASVAGLAIWAGERHSVIVNTTPVLVQHEPPTASGSAYAAAANAGLSFERTREHLQSNLRKGSAKHRRNRKAERANIESVPKLAQFPAPESLTEQEMLLIQFVEQDPKGAALFAEVRAKELQRTSDEMESLGNGTDLQERQTY
ncbi:MAG: hypothetical protein ACRD40_00945 [Candidatus Acidiferrales bacterium]